MSVLDSLTVGSRTAAYRQPAWMGLGNVFDHPVTDYAEMLSLSGLDQTEISEEEISPAGGAARFIVPQKALVHTDHASGERKVLGIVGDERTLIQPREAFSFLESMADGLQWEIVATLKDDRLVFGALRMDREIEVPGSANIQNFLTVATGYDGTMPLTWFVGPTRPECWNSLHYGMKTAEQSGKIRQTKNARDRMEVQRNMFRAANGYLDVWEKAIREMVETPCTDKRFENLVTHFYAKPDPEAGPAAQTKWDDKRDAHFAMWNAEHNSAIRGTAYGAWNVLTEVQQWGRNMRDGDKGREAFYLAGAGFDTVTERFRAAALARVRDVSGLAVV